MRYDGHDIFTILHLFLMCWVVPHGRELTDRFVCLGQALFVYLGVWVPADVSCSVLFSVCCFFETDVEPSSAAVGDVPVLGCCIAALGCVGCRCEVVGLLLLSSIASKCPVKFWNHCVSICSYDADRVGWHCERGDNHFTPVEVIM